LSALLEIADLRVTFATPAGEVRAVDGVDLAIERGETFGLVGESGSGKSATALAILRLHDAAKTRIDGRIALEGVDVLELEPRELRTLRGGRIAMVFQEPRAALDPVFSVGSQVAEALVAHGALEPDAARSSAGVRAAARALTIDLLRKVRLPDAERAFETYPHQMSGGMCQRAMIAAAIACRPALLVADEPTSALDVTVQAGILALLRELQAESRMSILLITHDLAVVAENARRAAVMYAGKIVEEGPVEELLARPRHPYTILLLRSRPGIGSRARLEPIAGAVESTLDRPSGCRFRLRCPLARAKCAEIEPELARDGESHRAACHFLEEASRL
jgi:oligopeptide/dipeptide ABC transporter ATP-binding protein